MPKAAYVEDYDSDHSSVRPGTAVKATTGRRRAASVRPPQKRDAASDSGYSSHNSAAQAQNVAANTSAARQSGQTKAKPVLHRTGSLRKSTSPSRSDPIPQHCNDPACQVPSCLSRHNSERRYTLPNSYTPEQLAAWNYYQQQQQAQPSPVTQYPPTSAPTTQPVAVSARQRAPSVSIPSRPMSIGGYPQTAPVERGPPPSPSAYANYLAYYPQGQVQGHPHPGYYGSTPPTQQLAQYPPPSPVSPGLMNYAAPPKQRAPTTYSARQVNPDIPGFEYGVGTVQPGLTRTASYRQPPRKQVMPGAYLDSESETDSETSESEREERERAARKAKRDSKLMPPPRRPSMSTHRYTEPAVSRTSRERLRRAPRSDTDACDPSSSDNFDSDRTARAVVDRPRTESSYSRSSRRPSVSTSGSGRTKATSVSSSSGYPKVLYVEDSRGRRLAYRSKEQQEDIIRQYQRQKLEEEERLDRIAAYQQEVSGATKDLTAENIRKAQTTQRRKSGSHVSGGAQSQRSGGSSSKISRPETGIEIRTGGTVLHLYGDAKLEMQASEDGSHKLIIGGGSNRGGDSAYYGSSKGSGSRVSGSRRGKPVPQDGYESGH
jgi:hypothetical protein